MRYALAVLLLTTTPASAMSYYNWSLEVVNPETGVVVKFFPYEDMDREQCTARLNDVVAKPPARVRCVGGVVKREFS
jgi:hypothetical protein